MGDELGRAVVPDVSSNHMVQRSPLRGAAGWTTAVAPTWSGILRPAKSAGLRSDTIASTSALAAISGRCPAVVSGGHSTIRPAMPSSVINACESRELIAHRQQDRAAGKFFDGTRETGAAAKI